MKDDVVSASHETAVEATEQPKAESVERADDFDRRGTYTMAFAHATHDLYGGFLGPLLPVVQDKLAVTLTIASLMIPAQQVPGIFQPFIGHLVDKTSRRWFVVLAPATTALSVSTIGLASNIYAVLVLLFISGLSSGAFHAPAVALMGEHGGRRMGRAMSIFMAGAEAARSLAPLIITAAIAWLTLEGSVAVAAFGVIASVILFFTIDTSASDAARRAAPSVDLKPIIQSRRVWLGALVMVTMLNAIATAPFHFFLVKFLADEKGYGNWYGGLALSIFFAAGVAGMLTGGVLSDRLGTRLSLAVFLTAATPLLLLYLLIENGGILPFLFLIPASATLTAVRPLMTASAQELMPEARGTIAGASLALSFVSLSLTAFLFGAIADRIGLESAFFGVTIASLLAVPFALLLPKRGQTPGDLA